MLAVHANQASKRTLTILWQAATDLVTVPHTDGQSTPFIPGDLNQALIELGSTVCKPRAPACGGCPIRSSCAALALDTKDSSKPTDIEDIVVSGSQCTACEPLPSSGGVTRFPMGKVRKKQREETDGAFVVFWGSWVLLARRPAKGACISFAPDESFARAGSLQIMHAAGPAHRLFRTPRRDQDSR